MNRFLRWLPRGMQAWMLEHGWLLVAGGVFALLVVGLLIFQRPDPLVEQQHMSAAVLSSVDVGGDDGFAVAFTLRLPDGQTVISRTRSLALATQVVDTACVAERRHASGKVRYKLAQPANCTDAAPKD